MSYEHFINLAPYPFGTTQKTKKMATKNQKELTDREAAILRYGIAFNITSPAKLYALAVDGSRDAAVATRWKQSQKVQEFLARETALWQEKQKAEKMRIEAEVLARVSARNKVSKPIAAEGEIDYTDPENIIRKLNVLINTAKDPKDLLDALKMMVATAPKPEQAEGHARQIRAYLPLTCERCPLYLKAKAHEN